MRPIAHALLFALASTASSAQVLVPEGPLPEVPADGGVLEVRVPRDFPIIAVASTSDDAGTHHHLVWGAGVSERMGLYVETQLTFFTVVAPGTVRLSVSNGQVHAKGGAHRHVWPATLVSWHLRPLAATWGGRRRFALSRYEGSGCPSVTTSHWLELRNGAITELLTTSHVGEGGADNYYFDGTSPVWPEANEGEADLISPERFGPISDVPQARRLVVYDEAVEASQLCRASRTIYRLTDKGLAQVRVEHLDAGCAN